jgi:hypothetical protein
LRGAKRRSNPVSACGKGARLDCFAAAQQQFILSDAAGGVEGLAMPE